MTLSFWKVLFSAQEVLDLLGECRDEPDPLSAFEDRFTEAAERRSRILDPAKGGIG